MPRSLLPRLPAPARALGLFAVLVTAAVLRPGTGQAETAPSLAGFSTLGEVHLDKSGCPSCPVALPTARRHRAFALASDSPFAIALAGRAEVTCADGGTYHVLLGSPRRGGPFQVVPNTCTNLDSRSITLDVTSVGLSPADAERKVSLIVYGSFG